MTYRARRKFTSSTFRVDDHICGIFLEPMTQMPSGFWIWNVGFAVGKSYRQLRDWYWKRKNKRARSLTNRLVGKSGMKAIRRGFEEVLSLRWNLFPGDALVLDCTSADPERQFHAWSRWHRWHPEWVIDPVKKEFLWYRPPYPDDSIWEHFDIKGVIPPEPLGPTGGGHYFDCFQMRLKGSRNYQSIQEIADLLHQDQFDPRFGEWREQSIPDLQDCSV